MAGISTNHITRSYCKVSDYKQQNQDFISNFAPLKALDMIIIQYIIIAVVLTACIAYALWRIRKALGVKTGDPCYGCALKKACRKKNARQDTKS